MGVTGLWKLLESSGEPVPLETLENKILAIDISIWLHQVVKGFQDNKGSGLAHAHLLGLYHRICKLLYYRIRPVFVFDGSVPQLKQQTIAKRNQGRNQIMNEADRIQNLLLKSLAKEKVVQQALGSNAIENLISPKKPVTEAATNKDDLFKLPEMPAICENDDEDVDDSYITETSLDCSTASGSSWDDNSLRHSYHHNIEAIDVKCALFKTLPADVRHEILTDIKATRKQSSWGRLHELPSESNKFSSYQMQKLLKRRQVQVSLEEAEKEMGGKSLTLNELRTLLTEEGIVEAASTSANKPVVSDENTRYLLVKDLTKQLSKAEQEEVKPELEIPENENIDSENDQLQHQDIGTEAGGTLKLTDEQRSLLKDSAMNHIARDYMKEYGGMNQSDIVELFEQSDNADNMSELDQSIRFKYNDNSILNSKPKINSESDSKPEPETSTSTSTSTSTATATATATDAVPVESNESDLDSSNLESTITKEEVAIKSEDEYEPYSDTDSDLEEVVEILEAHDMALRKLQIKIDLTKRVTVEDDIFADIFKGLGPLKEIPHESEYDEKTKNVDSEESMMFSPGHKVISIAPGANPTRVVAETNNTETILKSIVPKSDHEQAESKKNIETFLKGIIQSPDHAKNESKKNIEQAESKKNIETFLKGIIPNPDPVQITPNPENIESVLEATVPSLDHEEVTSKTKNIENLSLAITPNTIEEQLANQKNAKSILEDLKIEASKIKDLNLADIKILPQTIEISDSDDEPLVVYQSISVSPKEVIEIIDQNEAEKAPPKSNNKIDNFFETKFTIKRTPEKVNEEVPKVKSPFFVNRTPGKNQATTPKRNFENKEANTSAHSSKVVQNLFENQADEVEKDKNVNPLETAADLLKESKSVKELEQMAIDTRYEKITLEKERNRQERMGTSITEKMNRECMSLLRLFGIPYIVAPMEAEAQCAFLNTIELTDGTITDDSDIWLFGGRTVYKNFFDQKKHVLEYKSENIQRLYNVDRYKLIQLAILVGSDYTTGVNGIGAVTALEILAAFSQTPPKENETTDSMSVVSSLRKFREWWKSSKTIGPGSKIALKNKLKNIELSEGFPNISVAEAYLHPTIDNNNQKFSWGKPDVESLREFAKQKFGWTRIKTDDILNPVLKKMEEKKSQKSIKNYFNVKGAVTKKELKVSKRVQSAINKMSENYTSDEETPVEKKFKRTEKKRAGKMKIDQAPEEESDSESDDSMAIAKRLLLLKKANMKTGGPSGEIGESSKVHAEDHSIKDIPKPVIATKRIANIPDRNQVIPQKELSLIEMDARKKVAAEIFKRAKKE